MPRGIRGSNGGGKTESQRRSDFQRLARKRLFLVQEALRKIKNLSSPYGYGYTKGEVEAMFDWIKAEVEATKHPFFFRRKVPEDKLSEAFIAELRRQTKSVSFAEPAAEPETSDEPEASAEAGDEPEFSAEVAEPGEPEGDDEPASEPDDDVFEKPEPVEPPKPAAEQSKPEPPKPTEKAEADEAVAARAKGVDKVLAGDDLEIPDFLKRKPK